MHPSLRYVLVKLTNQIDQAGSLVQALIEATKWYAHRAIQIVAANSAFYLWFVSDKVYIFLNNYGFMLGDDIQIGSIHRPTLSETVCAAMPLRRKLNP